MSRDTVVGRRLDRHPVSAWCGERRREQPETEELNLVGGQDENLPFSCAWVHVWDSCVHVWVEERT